MIQTKNLTWLDLKEVDNIPKQLQNWLDDNQSLTAKLKAKYDDFSVNLLTQIQKKPHTNETVLLGDQQAIIREVELLGDQQVLVFARSVIPVTTDTERLLSIGSKPLGEILFDDPTITRSTMQITKAGNIWGRRSLFNVGKTQILVSEFFLEALYA